MVRQMIDVDDLDVGHERSAAGGDDVEKIGNSGRTSCGFVHQLREAE